MKAFKTLLILAVQFAMGSMSIKGAAITHGLIAWQTGVVLVIIVVFAVLTLMAIYTPAWIVRLTHEPQTA